MGKLLLTHKFVFVARQVHCRINYTLCIVLFLLHFNASSQCNTTSGIIEGYSFNDKDVNGIKSTSDLAMTNVIVKAFDNNGVKVAEAVSDANGYYKLVGLTDAANYRLEASKPTGYELTKYGLEFKGDIRFVQSPSCNNNFGYFQVSSYPSNPNPPVAVTCFVGGSTSENLNYETIVTQDYFFTSSSPVKKIAMKSQTGSIWGLAYKKSERKLFSSSFVKHGAAIGSAGIGGIYVTDRTTAATTEFVRLQDLGINLGSTNSVAITHCDYADFIGKTGLGDLEISDDESYLYASNLFNKSIVFIPTVNPDINSVFEIKVPDPGCNSGDYVISALKYQNGSLFVGVTCTAETSKKTSDFAFHIYEFNFISRVFNLVFTTNFGKKYWNKDASADKYLVSQWLTDIDFTDQGNMILAIADRQGHAYCHEPEPLVNQSGNILMVWNDRGTWRLENNGVAGTLIGSAAGTSYDGPGSGEFFGEDYWIIGPNLHSEVSFGSVVCLPGSNQVISTVFDPIIESFSGGLHRYSTINGKKSAAIQLYNRNNSSFGKASGLGALEIMDEPAPIEIGNYVWLDKDGDGVQDASEKGIAGVTLCLYDSDCNLVANTVSDANGEYVFSNSNVTGGIKFNSKYFIVVKANNYNTSLKAIIRNTDTLYLSKLDNAGDDDIDSDSYIWEETNCSTFTDYPVVTINTQSPGKNDYNFDIAFTPLVVIDTTPAPGPVIYDLALIKKLDVSSIIQVNRSIRFEMIVQNQGTNAVASYDLVDYIPSGFSFDNANNTGWVLNGNIAKYIVNEILLPNQKKSVFINLILLPNATADQLINTAEISGMRNEFGEKLIDNDSAPDEDPNNDKGGVPNSDTDNNFDNNINDEDDHDRESLVVNDLALIKTSNSTTVREGDIVEFVITVRNQGNSTIGSFDLVDYLPLGFSFETSLNPTWNQNGSNVTKSVNQILTAGQEYSEVLKLRVNSAAKNNAAALVNTAEISRMTDANGSDIMDSDSRPDSDSSNDVGGLVGTPSDNLWNGDGTSDEDDHDQAAVSIVDLALVLTTDRTIPVKNGDLISFKIQVKNQGTQAVNCIELVDYVPIGFEFVQAENNNWTYANGIAKSTITQVINPGDCLDFFIKLKVISGNPNELINKAEISSIKDASKNELHDWDSKQDTDNTNDAGGVVGTPMDNYFDGNGTDDEDDEDPATVPVFDLALILLNANVNPVRLGENITQTIKVCNQGNVSSYNTEIIDYLPSGFTLSSLDNNGWMIKNGRLVNIISGELKAGECREINLVLTVGEITSKSDLLNIAEVCAAKNGSGVEYGFYDYDSSPDKISSNDIGGIVSTATDDILTGDGITDEDDSDPAQVCIADIALRKTVAPNTILKYKGEVEFSIELFNQGNIAIKNIEIVDYLSAGFELSTKSITDSWFMDGNIAKYVYTGTIEPGMSAVVKIVLQGKSELVLADLINTAEVSNFTDVNNKTIGQYDYDSTPDQDPSNDLGSELGNSTDDQINDHGTIDEDDEDIADVGLYDIALSKSLKDRNAFISSRDTTVFYIDVINQGNRDIEHYSVTDQVDTNFLFYAPFNPGWVNTVDNLYTYTSSEPLKVGETKRIQIVLLFKPKRNGTRISNFAEICEIKDVNGDVIQDYDSTPDKDFSNDKVGTTLDDKNDNVNDHGETDEDDHDGSITNPDNFDLALFKEVAVRVVEKGDIVPWTIKIINQGTVTATEIVLVDYLPEGVTLVDPDWMQNPINPTPRKVYLVLNEKNGRLPVGGLKFKDTLIVDIQTRIDLSRKAGPIVNGAEIYSAKNEFNIVDEDSRPDDIDNNDDGGFVFEETDRVGSIDLGDLFDDEDDADPAGVFLLELKNDDCECLNNATNQIDGQFRTHLTLQSRAEEVWRVIAQVGLYDDSSPVPPASPVPLALGEELVPEVVNGPLAFYGIYVKHISGQAFSITLQNNYGDKINLTNVKCLYEAPKVTEAKNVVCVGELVPYRATYNALSTYNWTISSGGTIINSPTSNTINVLWSGAAGTTHTITLKESRASTCIAPIEIPVTISAPISEQISCINNLNVSLDYKCEAIVTPEMILVGGPYSYESYNVMLFDKFMNFIPNATLNSSYLGQTITAKVVNACDGNSCWAKILVEDKLKPTIACVNDTIDCFKLDSYLGPDVRDNCDSDPEKRFVDFRITTPDCDPDFAKIITRKYVAIDNYGTISDTCEMKIYLRHLELDSVAFPDSLSALTLNPLICNRFDADSITGSPEVWVTGVPMYHGRPLYPLQDHGYCNVKVWYEDIIDPAYKKCGKKMIRNWTVFRWYCNTFEKKVYPQLIEIIDTLAPTIICPYPIEATTSGAYKCEANVFVPMPVTYDSCVNEVTVDLVYPGGFIKDFKGGYVKLPAGHHSLLFRAYDRCHNVDSCTFDVHIKDNTPPVAICDRETAVSLDRFGEAWVPAHVFDDGSYDDCHIKSFKVRRMDNGTPCNYSSATFQDSVGFCCEDAGKIVTVIFQATDFEGNSNTCMVQVEVQDKTSPVVYCPHDVTISCENHFNRDSLHLFGLPTYSDNCNVTMEEVDSFNINQCRTGYIDRYFIASNSFGRTVCRQRITIENDNHFTEIDINWPNDFDTTTCASNALLPGVLNDSIGYPIVNEDFCDLTGVSYVDDQFRFVSGSDACYKILRKWKIINWCNIKDVNGDPIIYTHTQVIKVNNTIAPTIQSGCEDLKFTAPDTSCIGGNAVLVSDADDDCTPVDQLIWRYYIDLNSDGSLDITKYGVGGKIDASGFYPLGKHRIIYEYEDQCGNKSVCNNGFEIINLKKPIAYCRYGLAAGLVPMDLDGNGKIDAEMVTIWAKDFDQGSSHPCGYGLTYSFGTDTSIHSMTYDCDSIGRREVTLCVTATNGQQACCNTFIDIQDNNDVNFCNCVHFPPNITVSHCVPNYDPITINSSPDLSRCTCTHLSTTYQDSILTGVPNVCYVILRRWTVRLDCPDNHDLTIERVQRITVTTDLQRSDITWPADTVIIDNCVGNLDTLDVPHVLCDYNGNIMVMNSDRELPRTPECRFFERTWTVFSKCVPSQTYTFTHIVKLFNAGGLRYTVPSDVTIENCRASLLPDSLNGYPRINCPCPNAIHTYRDSTVFGLPNICYMIVRTWTTTYNCPPNVVGTFTGTQRIIISIQLRANDIRWPSDSLLVDNCDGNTDPSVINSFPVLLKDFCGYVSITHSDSTLLENDTCKVIRRRWVVANECTSGAARQSFTRDQKLKVIYPNGPRVIFPPTITVTDCRKPLLPDSLNGYPISLCPCDSVTFSYTDDTTRLNPEVCYTVLRTWNVRVRCRPIVDRTITGTQTIIVDVNLNPADIIWPQDTFNSFTCNPTLDPTITGRPSLRRDYCGLITFTFADTLIQGGNCRTLRRTWRAVNSCSATQTATFNQFLILRNQTPPSITCPPNQTLNADPSTCGRVVILPNPTQSNDCNTGVNYTRSKTDSLFDVGTTPVIFTATDSCGNVARCTTLITIIENVPPQIICPGDTTVPCSVSTVDLGQFGNATASDNCFTVTISQNVNRQQNLCGIGTITRVFVATDASGNTASCTQIITINNPDPLDSIDINWPQSPIQVEECGDISPATLGVPTIKPNVSCYKVRITSIDSNFCRTRGTCEIDRTWTVFDSCTNNAFTYIQTIQIDDNNAPTIVVQDTFIRYATPDSCNNFVTIIASIADCDSNIVVVTNNSPLWRDDR
jgi:uncharacterized repeat protein (TIGR01451 family)